MPAAVLTALLVAASPAGGDRVVEEVVAILRNPAGAPARIVTLTKLGEEARIALVSRGAMGAATGPLDGAALRAALEWLLDQMLLSDEAERLRIDEVRGEAVEAELGRFRARFRSPEEYLGFLASSDLAEEELLATLARMVRVQRYLESRVGGAARVTEDDIDRFLREREVAAGSAAARDAVRARLVEERSGSQVRELLAELRERAEIRILGQLGAGGGR